MSDSGRWMDGLLRDLEAAEAERDAARADADRLAAKWRAKQAADAAVRDAFDKAPGWPYPSLPGDHPALAAQATADAEWVDALAAHDAEVAGR